MRERLVQYVQAGWLRPLDYHTGCFLQRLSGAESPSLLLAAALASWVVGEGHVCLPLQAAERLFAGEPIRCPDLQTWKRELLASGIVGRPGDYKPLILDHADRLYLYRYFSYEQDVARAVHRRAAILHRIDSRQAARLLVSLFPESRQEMDWQKVAAALALLKPLVVISGGPGTGKTYTVARILALLQAMAGGTLRIGLAAPTGKAAARMQEAISQARGAIPPELAAHIPEQASTIHRLLAFRPDRNEFDYNRNRQLHLDLLVVDEASMIDISLMAALVRALPDSARLILLGDRNQLASVEAGRLFADLCGRGTNRWSESLRQALTSLCGSVINSGAPEADVDDCVVQLQKSHRFTTGSTIGRLARRINQGESLADLLGKRDREEDFRLLSSSGDTALDEVILAGFRQVFTAESPEQALERLAHFRILCVLRQGPTGVHAMNQRAEDILHQAGLGVSAGSWYRGRPIMINRNHYTLQLYNGDNGVVWPDRTGQLRVWFQAADGRLRPFAPSRLPSHETSYAITVHKSQGSEFGQILFVLPDEDLPLLSRELVYTAVTRARQRLILCGRQEVLESAIQRKICRYSGLAGLLRPSRQMDRISSQDR